MSVQSLVTEYNNLKGDYGGEIYRQIYELQSMGGYDLKPDTYGPLRNWLDAFEALSEDDQQDVIQQANIGAEGGRRRRKTKKAGRRKTKKAGRRRKTKKAGSWKY